MEIWKYGNCEVGNLVIGIVRLEIWTFGRLKSLRFCRPTLIPYLVTPMALTTLFCLNKILSRIINWFGVYVTLPQLLKTYYFPKYKYIVNITIRIKIDRRHHECSCKILVTTSEKSHRSRKNRQPSIVQNIKIFCVFRMIMLTKRRRKIHLVVKLYASCWSEILLIHPCSPAEGP